ncbi:MAG: HAD family hydrolase [Ghiorsea sp.]
MNKPAIKAVLLDLDGTLIDAFEPIIGAMQQTLVEFHLPEMTAQQIRRHTGRGDCSMIALFGERKEDAAKRFVEIHDLTYLDDIKVMDGAEQLLNSLSTRSIPTAVVTSKGQHRAEAQLKKLGWLNYFQSIVGKMDGRASKPSPEPLLLACENLGVDVSSVVMIGDGEADMKAASRAGCFGVGLTHYFSDEELKENGATICFKSLNEVNDWLK